MVLETPGENLACDEAFLELCSEQGVEMLRFWESRQPFVVLGYGNRAAVEVRLDECERRGVPVLRRCSGGGTVVQGPGCLNYSLTLRAPDSGPLATVAGANAFIMERHRAAFAELLRGPVAVQGHTDLAFRKDGGWFKFSGNAQRRRRHSLVFHGTVLHAFDLPAIGQLLRFPSSVPDYRSGRSHEDFVRNIAVPPEAVREALVRAWGAEPSDEPGPGAAIRRLCDTQYDRPDWNFRR